MQHNNFIFSAIDFCASSLEDIINWFTSRFKKIGIALIKEYGDLIPFFSQNPLSEVILSFFNTNVNTKTLLQYSIESNNNKLFDTLITDDKTIKIISNDISQYFQNPVSEGDETKTQYMHKLLLNLIRTDAIAPYKLLKIFILSPGNNEENAFKKFDALNIPLTDYNVENIEYALKLAMVKNDVNLVLHIFNHYKESLSETKESLVCTAIQNNKVEIGLALLENDIDDISKELCVCYEAFFIGDGEESSQLFQEKIENLCYPTNVAGDAAEMEYFVSFSPELYA